MLTLGSTLHFDQQPCLCFPTCTPSSTLQEEAAYSELFLAPSSLHKNAKSALLIVFFLLLLCIQAPASASCTSDSLSAPLFINLGQMTWQVGMLVLKVARRLRLYLLPSLSPCPVTTCLISLNASFTPLSGSSSLSAASNTVFNEVKAH